MKSNDSCVFLAANHKVSGSSTIRVKKGTVITDKNTPDCSWETASVIKCPASLLRARTSNNKLRLCS